MSAAEALRYLDNQAKRCRDRDDAEALCLLLPALLKMLNLEPMDNLAALNFTIEFRAALRSAKNERLEKS
jgi:hypothetical protein